MSSGGHTADAADVVKKQRFLIDAGKVLASSLDFEKTLSEVAHLAVCSIADCCIVDLLDEDGRARRLRLAVADPSKRELEEGFRAYPKSPGRLPCFARPALETGEARLEREVADDFVESIAEDDEHLRLLRLLDAKSFLSVPMKARDRVFGAIVFISSTRTYGEDDLGLAADLTARSALAIDNARLHSQAQQALRAREEILEIVAHDLRNPLNSIMLSAELIERILAMSGDVSRASVAVENILRSASRANRLIGDLLDLARIDIGTLAVEPRPVRACALVDEALQSNGPMLAEFTVERAAAAGLPMVEADRERILQVFSNLIGNAMKFTPRGGRISVGAWAGEAEVTFCVSDSGPGVTAEQARHLFDRHWQGKRTDRRGVGMGLGIAKGIVEAHGGRIWVECVPGEGCSFYFTVPLAAAEPVGE